MRFLLLLSLLSLFLMMPDATAQSSLNPGEQSPLNTISIRLRPGQDLKEELDKLVREQRIDAGLILTCVGSLTDASIRLANQEKATTYLGHFEIVSLVGTLSINGSHIHLSVSDSTGRTIGGHLMAGNKIYTTAELVIGILPAVTYTREPDPTFGYRELVIRRKKRK
ncbi:MAG: DNA-binding protein [Cytophagaceae bacterium]|nr:MAG: DNA-binding protein [Cytophagaceae bacterium]